MSKNRKRRCLKFKYAVLGEGITEQWYLKHLKSHKNYVYSIRPSLFTDIGIENAGGIIDELILGGCDQIIFLTDYDTIVNQDKAKEFDIFVNKYKDVEGVFICASMPSIEYWFLLHFVYTTKEYINCDEVVRDLKKYIIDFSKKKIFLEKDKWFKQLIDNDGLNKAIKNAQKGIKRYAQDNVGEHFPFTKMAEMLDEFEKQKKE